MTLPLAWLPDYQSFPASVTSKGTFTMETPHRSLPFVAYYGAAATSAGPGSGQQSLSTSKHTHRQLLMLILSQTTKTVIFKYVPEGLIVVSL